jgi:transcriptional regulator with XRE-family HTH domain
MADKARTRPLLRTVVGEVLRRHRLEQRRTLAEVAKEACVSVPYLSEVERGLKEPSSEVLAAVCDSLRIDLPDLLAEVRRDLTDRAAPIFRLADARLQRAHLGQSGISRPAAPPATGGTVMLLAA